jgi:hypothetical protein
VKTVQVSRGRQQFANPVRAGGVSSAIKTSGLLARDTNQAMNRRMKLNDALGKLTGK